MEENVGNAVIILGSIFAIDAMAWLAHLESTRLMDASRYTR